MPDPNFRLEAADLHRGQFLLGPDPLKPTTTWQQVRIGTSLHLATHPSLPVTRVERDGRSLVLLGYLLDPERAEADDEEILDGLLASFESCRELPLQTAGLGGRWILIASAGEDRLLFHDAAGLRQVSYAVSEDGVWCASQPNQLATQLACPRDRAATRFFESTEFQFMSGGHWWPGTGTPFTNVRHLLPNHYLDLRTGNCRRYWPDGPLATLSLEEGAATSAILLKGMMHAVARRFPLTLMITAGRDSRTILAASREIREQLRYLSIGAEDDPDTLRPAELLGRFGLDHEIADNRRKPQRRFWKLYRSNSPLANKTYAADAEAIAPLLARERVAITGHVSEIAKSFYAWRTERRDAMTPEELARLTGMGRHPFAVAAYADWLDGAADRHNIDLLDLFYWEQRAGNWLPMWLLEYDLVWRDCVTPFNCRRLLTTMLSVGEEYRWRKKYELYGRIIGELWPELLEIPFGGAGPRRQGFGKALRERRHRLHKRWHRLWHR